MIAWSWRTADSGAEPGRVVAVRRRDWLRGAGVRLWTDPLDALAEATGTIAVRCEVLGDDVRGWPSTFSESEIVARAARILAVRDERSMLAGWACECECPAARAELDPALCAWVYSPAPDDPQYEAARAEFAARLEATA